VFNGGTASSTTVSGGTVTVSSGGTAANTTVSGGNLLVSNGGTAVSATIFSGAERVSSGGTINGATLSGGTVEIFSSGTAGSSTITISSGTLILDDSVHFSGSIAGLLTSGVQNVDLVDISVATLQTLAYSDSGTSGTLTVTDGTHTALLHMIGTYTQASFKTTNDGGGGTLLTDPPVSSGAGVATPH
jgi:autotransporter passenger strand-loop-strand repeat protein